jgi:hypothetical protein
MREVASVAIGLRSAYRVGERTRNDRESVNQTQESPFKYSDSIAGRHVGPGQKYHRTEHQGKVRDSDQEHPSLL